MRSSLVDLASSERCVGCARRGRMLCSSCGMGLRTALPRPPPPPLARLGAAWDYQGAARALVLALKLSGLKRAGEPLADALRLLALTSGVGGAVVTWVPGRRRDLRRRGFDHAEVLARLLAARLGLRALPLLVRGAERPDQTSLDAPGRWSNLEGAFRARQWDGPVLLVDDLITTGATAQSCGAALMLAGASSVEAMAPCSAELLVPIPPGARHKCPPQGPGSR